MGSAADGRTRRSDLDPADRRTTLADQHAAHHLLRDYEPAELHPASGEPLPEAVARRERRDRRRGFVLAGLVFGPIVAAIVWAVWS